MRGVPRWGRRSLCRGGGPSAGAARSGPGRRAQCRGGGPCQCKDGGPSAGAAGPMQGRRAQCRGGGLSGVEGSAPGRRAQCLGVRPSAVAVGSVHRQRAQCRESYGAQQAIRPRNKVRQLDAKWGRVRFELEGGGSLADAPSVSRQTLFQDFIYRRKSSRPSTASSYGALSPS